MQEREVGGLRGEVEGYLKVGRGDAQGRCPSSKQITCSGLAQGLTPEFDEQNVKTISRSHRYD